MRRRIIATKGKTHAEQAADQPIKVRGEQDQDHEQGEQCHLGDEHWFAP
jgi:hypothetical protein